jgi:hypothetical protein
VVFTPGSYLDDTIDVIGWTGFRRDGFGSIECHGSSTNKHDLLPEVL